MIGAGTISPCSVDHTEGDHGGFRHIRIGRSEGVNVCHVFGNGVFGSIRRNIPRAAFIAGIRLHSGWHLSGVQSSVAVCECDFYRLIGAGTISPCSVDHLEGDQSGFRHIRLRRVGRIGCIHISEYNLTAQIVGCWRKGILLLLRIHLARIGFGVQNTDNIVRIAVFQDLSDGVAAADLQIMERIGPVCRERDARFLRRPIFEDKGKLVIWVSQVTLLYLMGHGNGAAVRCDILRGHPDGRIALADGEAKRLAAVDRLCRSGRCGDTVEIIPVSGELVQGIGSRRELFHHHSGVVVRPFVDGPIRADNTFIVGISGTHQTERKCAISAGGRFGNSYTADQHIGIQGIDHAPSVRGRLRGVIRIGADLLYGVVDLSGCVVILGNGPCVFPIIICGNIDRLSDRGIAVIKLELDGVRPQAVHIIIVHPCLCAGDLDGRHRHCDLGGGAGLQSGGVGDRHRIGRCASPLAGHLLQCTVNGCDRWIGKLIGQMVSRRGIDLQRQRLALRDAQCNILCRDGRRCNEERMIDQIFARLIRIRDGDGPFCRQAVASRAVKVRHDGGNQFFVTVLNILQF